MPRVSRRAVVQRLVALREQTFTANGATFRTVAATLPGTLHYDHTARAADGVARVVVRLANG